MKQYYVYIMTNKPQGILYIGITNNIVRRVYEHKHNLAGGFCSKYKLYKLAYYEISTDVYQAITREKWLKRWRRKWKDELINNFNPNWDDLYHSIVG